jgi:hypothetical protein
MHVIKYVHERDGVLYHGTLSDLDGVPKATWSYDKDGRRVTREQSIDAATFRSLWNWVGKLHVFKQHRVRDLDREMDWAGTHVVTIAFGEPDDPKQVSFAVPIDEADPHFRDWLKALDVSMPGAGPPLMPARAQKPKGPAAARERAYTKLIGSEFTVDHEDDPDGPAIDVYVFEPDKDAGGRDFFTLVTSGMSDERMRAPSGSSFDGPSWCCTSRRRPRSTSTCFASWPDCRSFRRRPGTGSGPR